VRWTLIDNLGSVRRVVEYDRSNTTVAETLDFDAFGNVMSESNASNSPLFKLRHLSDGSLRPDDEHAHERDRSVRPWDEPHVR
jgi:hypothetical protein